MVMRKAKLSLIIPAYNEEKRIKDTLEQYAKFFSGKMDYEIIVITDGCTDRTVEVIKEVTRKHPNVRNRDYPKKLGKGGAVLKGFELARGELVAYADADGATPPKELMKLIKKMGRYDGAIGSRWMEGSSMMQKQPLSRRIASRILNALVRALLGMPYKDTQCGAKVFKRNAIKGILEGVKTTNFAFDITLLFHMNRKGFRIKEVPIKWSDRDFSTLKISRAAPRMFLVIIKLLFKR